MSESVNPYTAPKAETIASPAGNADPANYYLEGKLLAIRKETDLPNLCIITGEEIPDAKRRKKVLYWANPMWALLIIIAWPIYVIVYFCVRQKAIVRYSISASALRKRALKIAASVILLLGAIAGTVFFFLRAADDDSNIGFGFLGIVASIILLLFFSYACTFLRVKKMKNEWFLITGTGKKFREKMNEKYNGTGIGFY
ncbi:MAG: hypothetical protein ACPG32_08895 [Akkermansiaceae bacterium]